MSMDASNPSIIAPAGWPFLRFWFVTFFLQNAWHAYYTCWVMLDGSVLILYCCVSSSTDLCSRALRIRTQFFLNGRDTPNLACFHSHKWNILKRGWWQYMAHHKLKSISTHIGSPKHRFVNDLISNCHFAMDICLYGYPKTSDIV